MIPITLHHISALKLLDRKVLLSRAAHKEVIRVVSGRTVTTLSSMALLNTALSMVHSNPLHLNHWHLKTIIQTMRLRATTIPLSSTVHNSLPNNSSIINHPSTVLPMADLHNNGQALLSMVSHHSVTAVAVVEDLTIVVVAMKLLSWAHQSVWDLTITSETTWLKRAMASLSIQTIKVPLLFSSLNQRIKVIRRKVMEDNVHHLIPTHSLALNEAEET
jgi:hypothetical protein